MSCRVVCSWAAGVDPHSAWGDTTHLTASLAGYQSLHLLCLCQVKLCGSQDAVHGLPLPLLQARGIVPHKPQYRQSHFIHHNSVATLSHLQEGIVAVCTYWRGAHLVNCRQHSSERHGQCLHSLHSPEAHADVEHSPSQQQHIVSVDPAHTNTH